MNGLSVALIFGMIAWPGEVQMQMQMQMQKAWPDFRGPRGDGHSDARGLPLTWSETENVRWKTAIPGRGWSSPVVWRDQVWLTTAPADGHELRAVAVDRRTGAICHNVRVFDVGQPQELDPTNSYASPSPVVEEDRVYVHFGTYGTACLDTISGSVVWQRRWGGNYAASPVLAEGRIYFFSEEGKTTVIRPARDYQELAINHLDDGFMASPAVADNALYLRTRTHLYRIAVPEGEAGVH